MERKENPASREGWTKPQPETIPPPTYAPVVVALGVAMMLWGILTTWGISAVGAAVFATGLAAWIGALRHEHK